MVRPGRERLFGIIEVDETYTGGKKAGKLGRGAEGKALVLIAAQIDGKRIGRIRLQRIPDASGKSLANAIKSHIEPGSTVRTDSWQGYHGIENQGYIHEVVRDEFHIGENLLPKAHLVASLLKRWLLGTWRWTPKTGQCDKVWLNP